MQRKRNPFALLVGTQAGAATLENSMEVPQKIKNRTTLQSSNCTTRYLSKRYRCAISEGHMHSNVYSSAIDNSQSMDRAQMSTDGCMDKENVVCVYVCVCVSIYIDIDIDIPTMEYYSAIKKNEILPFATTWTELEGIMLSEISQSEKDKYHMTSLLCGI